MKKLCDVLKVELDNKFLFCCVCQTSKALLVKANANYSTLRCVSGNQNATDNTSVGTSCTSDTSGTSGTSSTSTNGDNGSGNGANIIRYRLGENDWGFRDKKYGFLDDEENCNDYTKEVCNQYNVSQFFNKMKHRNRYFHILTINLNSNSNSTNGDCHNRKSKYNQENNEKFILFKSISKMTFKRNSQPTVCVFFATVVLCFIFYFLCVGVMIQENKIMGKQ